MDTTLASLAHTWVHNPWLLWGAGPMLSASFGFFLTAALLELLIRTPQLSTSLICYTSSNATPRRELLSATHQRIPFTKQLLACVWVLFGPPAAASGAILAATMRTAAPTKHLTGSFLPASALEAGWQLLALFLLADFGLYWGHRIQHEFEFLWQFHRHHHSIDTPTPFSTLYIHPHDYSLQGCVPILLAALLIRPAPAVLYLFTLARIAENALNHSGLDSWLVDLLTLKSLPLRASIAHHDAHHKFSNHPLGARNYGESFWIWDAAFGTTNRLVGRAPGAKRA